MFRLKAAAKILNDEHYGIDKAKERILEFLAVMKIKKQKFKNTENQKLTRRFFVLLVLRE